LELSLVALERKNRQVTEEAARVREAADREAPGEAGPTLAARLGEAADLLRGYVESGRIGAHTEYHCGCTLNIFGAWWRAKEGDPWYGQPCPLGGLAEHLRQYLQIDKWRTPAGEG
jgi:hypothetical protein